MKYLLIFLSLAFSFIAIFVFAKLACERYNMLLINKRHSNNKMTLEDVINDPLLCFAIFAAIACILAGLISLWLLPLCIFVAYVLSKRAPVWLKKNKQRQLRAKCEAQLDIMADILAMGVRAGLPFDSSLKLFISRFKSPLAHELNKAMLRWQSGLQTRSNSFKALADSLQSKMFARFAKTAVHAIGQGAPLADMLTQFSKEVREQRSTEIEKKVEKTPVKMFVPMGTCMLPAMLIFVMGPVVLQFIGSSA